MTAQNTAYARAETMMFIAKYEAAGLKWGQISGLLKAEAAKDGSTILAPSHMTVRRWAALIAGVDGVNWAPALAPAYRGRTVTAEISPEAWEQFEFRVYASGKNGTGYPLKAAWEDVAGDASVHGWAWPCYRTVMRHWDRMDEARKRVLRYGEDAAAKSLKQFQPRTVKQMFAMQQVELDGREFKVLVRFRDGRIGCPWVIIYVDRASNRILSHVVSESENEEAAADATIQLCETHGIPDLVYTDNGAAFNGKRMAGGLKPLIRRKNTLGPDWDVPGVLKIFGIRLDNTAPNRGQSKIPESVFSIMRRFDNDPVFYRAQRSGPNDTPNPNPIPVDIALFEKALEKYIHAFNDRSHAKEMASSYMQLLAEIHEGKIVTALERCRAAGKVVPANEEWALELASRDLGLFEQWEAGAPAIVNLGGPRLAGRTPPPLDRGRFRGNTERAAICAQLGLDE